MLRKAEGALLREVFLYISPISRLYLAYISTGGGHAAPRGAASSARRDGRRQPARVHGLTRRLLDGAICAAAAAEYAQPGHRGRRGRRGWRGWRGWRAVQRPKTAGGGGGGGRGGGGARCGAPFLRYRRLRLRRDEGGRGAGRRASA